MSAARQRRVRRAARVVLLDAADRVLLFRGVVDYAAPFWFLPGGECEPGEAYAEAAARELREETGIQARPAPLGIETQVEYVHLREPVIAVEQLFWHRTSSAAVDTAGHTDDERALIQQHRWFARGEIAGWPERVYPLDLADLIGQVIARERGVIA